jgi:hypothetical protein
LKVTIRDSSFDIAQARMKIPRQKTDLEIVLAMSRLNRQLSMSSLDLQSRREKQLWAGYPPMLNKLNMTL